MNKDIIIITMHKKGINQKELSKKMACSQAQLSRIINGQRSTSIAKAKKMAKILDIKICALLKAN